MRTCWRASNSSTHLPAPIATECSGLSVMWIGIPVSCFSRSSRPRRRAPPPVRTMPRSMTSPESSGGVLSSVVLTASTIWLTGSSIALRISSLLTTIVLGRPETRARPRISACGSAGAGEGEGGGAAVPGVRLVGRREGRADRHLDLLGGPLAEHQAVLLLHVLDDRAVELVTPDADALAGDDAAERDHGDLGRAAADVDDHVAGRLVHGQPGADRGGHRLLDDVDLARTGLVAGVLDRALLDARDAGRDADDDPRLREVPAAVHLLDEVAQHPLGRLEVGDDAVLQRADGHDVARRTADHPLRLGADGEDPRGVGVDRDDARLVEHDALAADVDEGVGGAEVHGHVSTEEREIVRHEGAR